MIKFDPTLLSTEIVLLKSVTTSLGGSISVIDDAKSAASGKEETTRIEVPMATARAFIVATKNVTKYLKPVYVALAKYNGMVIAMERHPLAGMGELEIDTPFGMKRWEPRIEVNIRDVIEPLLQNKEWYFDGRYMFSFATPDMDVMVREGTFLTSDGAFRKINAQTVDMQSLHTVDALATDERNCLAFVTSLGDTAISPPIWKDLAGIGNHQMKRSSTEDEMEDEDNAGVTITRFEESPFDRIDSMMSVNLNFALKAGQEIGKMFGYEYVEPLQLSRLMIELHTVNLPNVPKQVKATYDSGMKFTHALAWLLGMSRRAHTLETYVMMRSLLTYLTRKGIFRSDAFDASAVFRNGKSTSDVAVKSVSELMGDLDFTHQTLAGILADAKAGIKAMKKQHDTIGGGSLE